MAVLIGKGAIVVPTGFLTAKSSVEGTVLKKLVEDHIVYGAVPYLIDTLNYRL